jgi:phage FluMu protein Com
MKTNESSMPTGQVRCPKCYSLDVRYSKRGLWDSVLDRFFQMEVFRCRSCRKRFHVYIPDEEPEK